MKKSFIKFANGMEWVIQDDTKNQDEIISGSGNGMIFFGVDWASKDGDYSTIVGFNDKGELVYYERL